jgi:hypothetical protein
MLNMRFTIDYKATMACNINLPPKKNNKSMLKTSNSYNVTWFTPNTLDELYQLMVDIMLFRSYQLYVKDTYQNDTIKLVVGNTSSGIYKNEHPNVYISLAAIPELTAVLLSIKIMHGHIFY